MQCKPKVIVNNHVERGGVAVHRAAVGGPFEDRRIPKLGGHRVEADRAKELVGELRELMGLVSFLEHHFPELSIWRVRVRLDAVQDRAPLLRPQVPFERQHNIELMRSQQSSYARVPSRWAGIGSRGPKRPGYCLRSL